MAHGSFIKERALCPAYTLGLFKKKKTEVLDFGVLKPGLLYDGARHISQACSVDSDCDQD